MLARLGLESWLPKALHGEINHVLVGFGQVRILVDLWISFPPFRSFVLLFCFWVEATEGLIDAMCIDHLPTRRSEMRRVYVEHGGPMSERAERPYPHPNQDVDAKAV